MKTEPELIDIIAMLLLPALIQKHKIVKSKIDIAYEAYEQAQAMMDVREDFINKGGN
jgi:hypothetical protein